MKKLFFFSLFVFTAVGNMIQASGDYTFGLWPNDPVCFIDDYLYLKKRGPVDLSCQAMRIRPKEGYENNQVRIFFVDPTQPQTYYQLHEFNFADGYENGRTIHFDNAGSKPTSHYRIYVSGPPGENSFREISAAEALEYALVKNFGCKVTDRFPENSIVLSITKPRLPIFCTRGSLR
jgi:hypothetical protein